MSMIYYLLVVGMLLSPVRYCENDRPKLKITLEETIDEEVIEDTKDEEVIEDTKDEFIPYEIPLHNYLQRYIWDLCIEKDIPFEIVLAIIEVESEFNEKANRANEDFGLMQINVVNHKWLKEELGITDFFNPQQNIQAGIRILEELYGELDDVNQILMAYNMGIQGASRLWNKGIYETGYTDKIYAVLDERY